uniref:Ubiquinone biosynthesis protein UbiV n=1 Tax=Candidatus Kentrum eta TaxID=2126337 RepID=A0A450UGQ4_9GAMM|nr:MAG: Collagenase-like protease, PrtC family [Candidatus Kentron sp. H]VFJ91706.1 MAG: Collagenase-like protease, PrtC family [Candidatus Kentron sp. H]VFJ98339.1 MAG: Collagenase-like protease, PrtC family [Candidatus Kentron sp. H]
MKLALAPIPYFWSADAISAFYDRVADWPVDIVYLGETICGKRRILALEDWLTIGQRLTEAGKQVVLSTMALLEADSELATLARICANGVFPVEANDVGAIRLLTEPAEPAPTPTPFIIGPHINAYNVGALSLLSALGAMRWVMPPELPRTTLADLQETRPAGIETEVFVYGRLPLAFSARCFAARAHNRPKDQCDFCCGNYPDGLPLATQEAQALFTINGIQVQSAGPCNLLMALETLRDLKVDILRIVPQSQDMAAVVRAFHGALSGETTVRAALDALPPPGPRGWCNGYWEGEAGMLFMEEEEGH